MTPEKPTLEIATVPVSNTEVTRDAETAPHIIEVDEVPGIEQSVEVRHSLGSNALRLSGRETVPIAPENVTPQMMANALGSPFHRDEIGRIVPNESKEA